MKFPRPSTLHVVLPIGQTVGLAILILLLLVSLLEVVFRQPAVMSRLPAPSIGSTHEQLEIQVYRLHQFAASGSVDCIVLGSSMVRMGIKPTAFADAYSGQTGESLRCFTFGLDGLTTSAAGILAEYLVNTYHPRLLIYGVSPRDFNEEVVIQDFSGKSVAQLDWMKYERGTFNITGWMFAHLHAFQYAYFYRDCLMPSFAGKVERRRLEESLIEPDGYSPFDRVLTWPISDKQRENITKLFQDYKPVPEELAGLQQIIRLHQSGQTRLAIVEVPFYPDVMALLGTDKYEYFNRQVESYTLLAGVLYWPTTRLDLIPDEGWANLTHLNTTGAEIFSRWLGEQIGQAANQGGLAP